MDAFLLINRTDDANTIVSLIPVRMSTGLIATIIEMIMMVPISSFVAKMKLLKTPDTEPLSVSVASKPGIRVISGVHGHLVVQ
ncbi:hypothetical protein SAMN04487897_102796 [Paenibacillus sp. yr247]|nr:hypothetical protein SAMN04487897_102796 [Paenibacillus sp. yr247]